MKSKKEDWWIIIGLFVLLLCSAKIYGQSKSQGNSNISSFRGVIVGKEGVAYRTNPDGECSLVIPDWLLERIKKAPSKYRLKISIGKIPPKILESKLTDNAKVGITNDLRLKFSYTVANGNKKIKGDSSELVNKSNISSIAAKKTDLPIFALTNPHESIVIVTYTLTSYQNPNVAEPVPGAEVYVELEPDDEP